MQVLLHPTRSLRCGCAVPVSEVWTVCCWHGAVQCVCACLQPSLYLLRVCVCLCVPAGCKLEHFPLDVPAVDTYRPKPSV